MKIFFKTILSVFIVFLTLQSAKAIVTFNVVVLPVDLFKVCANYYCYPEVSEIISADVIENFNATGRINSPSLSYVRKVMASNENLRKQTYKLLGEYSKTKSLDFTALKAISKTFSANSVLIISNTVPVDKEVARRNVWEMLVLSTNFDISYPYTMETNAVLVDTVNDLVMWNNTYTKKISDNNDNFKAPNASDAYAILEYFKMYSKDILSKNISQNIYLRFFPRVIDPQPIVNDSKPEGAYFRFESDANIPALQNQLIQHQRQKYAETDEDSQEQYGDVMYSD
ncbi:MAG: hypothetical protein VZR09_05400 [Candidatus Gastranaerophilaceae bacterium]|nr:hypothetical protein [Candidatus Gastranaerophilaceae bacterium]